MLSGDQIPPVRIPPQPAPRSPLAKTLRSPLPNTRRRRWLYVAMGCGGIAAVLVCSGLVFLAREYLIEVSGKGFHVDRAAASAFREARQMRPACKLRLTGYYDRVTSMVYVNADLVTSANPKGFVQLEIRGVSLLVEQGIYDHQRFSHPIVMHQGSDPTKGYSVKFWRKADAFGG